MPLVLIGLGGFVGAATRYIVDGVVSDRTGGSFPFGTLVVNGSGVVLDPVAHEVRRDGVLIHLRPKEYQLLAIVDVHVRWLRSKIEPQPDAPVHLVTVRGVGYRLDALSR